MFREVTVEKTRVKTHTARCHHKGPFLSTVNSSYVALLILGVKARWNGLGVLNLST
jgi:hypothetical protein